MTRHHENWKAHVTWYPRDQTQTQQEQYMVTVRGAVYRFFSGEQSVTVTNSVALSSVPVRLLLFSRGI